MSSTQRCRPYRSILLRLVLPRQCLALLWRAMPSNQSIYVVFHFGYPHHRLYPCRRIGHYRPRSRLLPAT